MFTGVSKMKAYENEDRRPKMGLRNYENEDPLRKRRPTTKTKTHYENEDPSLFSYYENEDPLRKRRPIFVFVLRKRRPTTKTKTIKYSFIRYFRENKRKSVAKNFR